VPSGGQQALSLSQTARRALISTVVVLGLLVLVLAVWEMRLIVLLLLTAIVVACAMQSGVDALHTRGIPRGIGVGLHYAALLGLLALLLAFAIPTATSQVRHAISTLPEVQRDVHEEASESQGLKRDLLTGLESRLADLPSRQKLVEPGFEVTTRAVELFVGFFFVFASAAYWISERERIERGVLALLPRSKRKTVSDTWRLVDLKLGAFVRGQLVLVVLVGAVLSFVFWAIGLPYWLLIGAFAGVVEIVPVIGPLAAGALAVAVGFTVSWPTALAAGMAVLLVRVLEDYLVMPRVLGDAVGLSPLIVLTAVAATGVVLGGVAVLLAIPIAALFATLVDVLVLQKDPSEEDVPSVIFPAGETDGRSV
jgi:predicted PurR-regulated permease PerM